MHALREDQIDDGTEQEGKSRENEAQCQRGDEVEVQRPAPEDVGVRTLLAPARLTQVPPQADSSDQCERNPVEDTSDRLADRVVFVRKDETADTEERRDGAPQEKPNPRQGGQVVVELSKDEGGSTLPFLSFP
jgi:hypothetical protein